MLPALVSCPIQGASRDEERHTRRQKRKGGKPTRDDIAQGTRGLCWRSGTAREASGCTRSCGGERGAATATGTLVGRAHAMPRGPVGAGGESSVVYRGQLTPTKFVKSFVKYCLNIRKFISYIVKLTPMTPTMFSARFATEWEERRGRPQQAPLPSPEREKRRLEEAE